MSATTVFTQFIFFDKRIFRISAFIRTANIAVAKEAASKIVKKKSKWQL